MRVGIPTNNKTMVEGHFGHCKEFALYDIDGEIISKPMYVTPPPHAPGVIPKFLSEHKASVIICGGMGQSAINLFKENNIKVILGASGSVDTNLQNFIKGDLISTGAVCEHNHDHH